MVKMKNFSWGTMPPDRAAEKIAGAQGKYKEWDPQYGLCEGGLRSLLGLSFVCHDITTSKLSLTSFKVWFFMSYLLWLPPCPLLFNFLHMVFFPSCKCLVGSVFWAYFLWAFGLTSSSSVFVVYTYTQKSLYPHLLVTAVIFVAHSTNLHRVIPSPLMMQVALILVR